MPDDCRRERAVGQTRSSYAILPFKQKRAIVLATKPSILVGRFAQIAVANRCDFERDISGSFVPFPAGPEGEECARARSRSAPAPLRGEA